MSEVTRDRLMTAEDGVRHEGQSTTARAPLPVPPPSVKHLGELYRKVDATFARANARHRPRMACGSGCDDCCRQTISVTGVEAGLLQGALAALPPEVKRALTARAALAAEAAGSCPALDDRGACAVYEARPLACRTQGMPLRLGPQPGVRSLPVVQACAKNFVGHDLSGLDAASVLDMRTLGNVLNALDEAYADEVGVPRGERLDMTAVLAGALAG
jgi:uncharacterized protein